MFQTSRLIGWLIALLLMAGGACLLYYYFGSSARESFPNLASVSQLKRNGNNQAVLTQIQQILADPAKSAEEKTNAELYGTGVAFSVSGDPNDLIKEVQKMKSIVIDTSLSPEVRAVAMSVLGNEFSVSGRNTAVFAEIYKDPPFNAYLVPGSQSLSALNLQKASYDIKPTSFAAVKVADIATSQYFSNPQQGASTTASYAALAEDYLIKADTAAIEEAKLNPGVYYTNDRYILYKLSRTFVIGRLAVEKGAPYTSMYAKEFESFIKAAQTGNSTLSKNSLYEARFQYAKILAALQDQTSEKKQLDLLAGDLNSIQDGTVPPLVLSLKNTRLKAPTGQTWVAVQKMMTVSPDFGSIINKLTAPSGS